MFLAHNRRCKAPLDEGEAYATRLRDAVVEVTLKEVPGALNGFASLLGRKEGA